MTGPTINYNTEQFQLEEVLNSIDRPGCFFAEGRPCFAPPLMVVDEIGTIAFPILDAPARALVGVAQRSPYGKGKDTIIDTSVRDCWQIGADSVHFPSVNWQRTLASILDTVALQLGLPRDQVDAHLYKLLVYETGGFFAEHRDTEKVDGMVATLVVALPAAGTGGELVVRHGDSEAVVDLCVRDPGELAFAAFYADCAHRTEPVRSGHRVSLVYNIVVKQGSGTIPATAPDVARQAERAGRLLASWAAGPREERKLVWLLEHAYSGAGLSFGSLKGADAAVAAALIPAAEVAACALHLAILDIGMRGIPSEDRDFAESSEDDELDVDAPLEYVHSSKYTLGGWVGGTGNSASILPTIPLQAEEALPNGGADDLLPCIQKVKPTGNEGVTLERAYRLAALVLWPKAEAVRVIADGSIGAAVRFASAELESAGSTEASHALGRSLVPQLIEAWQERRDGLESAPDTDDGGESIRRMLDLLRAVGDTAQTAKFIDFAVTHKYHPALNEALLAALRTVGTDELAAVVSVLVEYKLQGHFVGGVDLLSRLHGPLGVKDAAAGNRLRTDVARAFHAFPQRLAKLSEKPSRGWATDVQQFDAGEIRDLFLAAHRLGLESEAAEMAAEIGRNPRVVDPCRTLPAALAAIRSRAPSLAQKPELIGLWHRASSALLARSAAPPTPQGSLRIDAHFGCSCPHCGAIRAFLLDPEAKILRYPAPASVREHLVGWLWSVEDHLAWKTERRGRPYTLICAKRVASGHDHRVRAYKADIEGMRSLLSASPGSDQPADADTVEALTVAVSRMVEAVPDSLASR